MLKSKINLQSEPNVFGDAILCATINEKEIHKIPHTINGRNFVYILTLNEEIVYVGRS